MSKNTLIPVPEETAPQTENVVTISRSGAARQQTIRNIGLIIGREYKNRVFQRVFVITTSIILVLFAIGTCIPTIIQYITSRASSSNQAVALTIINSAGKIGPLDNTALTSYISNSLNGNNSNQSTGSPNHFMVNLDTAANETTLQNEAKSGKLSSLLILERTSNKVLTFTTYSSDSDSDITQIQGLAKQLNVLDQSSQLGLSTAQTQSLFAAPNFKLINTQQNQDQRSTGEQVASYILAYVGIILIFMSVFMYGMGVATGVAEEKGSRIMEILINAATPFQLMAGKIIGIGLAGLTQMVLLVTVGIIGFLLQPALKTILGLPTGGPLNIDISGTSIMLLLLVLLYFILGFLLYSTMFAAVGALVKRQEEVQSAAQPITWLFMIGYLASFAGVSTPNALWVRIISYIPFWTPTTMLMRIGSGQVAAWEIWLTIGLMLVATFICTMISARIYRSGILMYGQKPNIKQLFKLARAK